jgi:hypothetical protein
MLESIHNRNDIGPYCNSVGLVGEGVEVGVWEGTFADEILSHWLGKRLYMVDPWVHQDELEYKDAHNLTTELMDKVYAKALAVAAKHGDRAKIIRDLSLNAVTQFKDESLDFVYLDGNHTYQACWEDATAWWNKIKTGGILCGHDFFDDTVNLHRWSEVKTCMTKWVMEKLNIDIEKDTSGRTKLTEYCSSWYILK